MDSMNEGQRYTAMYRRHYDAIETYVARRAQPGSVTDVVADVFLTAWRRFHELPADRQLPWLYGVARRTLANDRRSQQRRSSLSELLAAQPAVALDGHADDVIAAADFARAFDELNLNDQEVLRLTVWENLEPAEVAKVLNCGTAAARVRLHRARKRFAKLLFVSDSRPVNSVREDTNA
ncbi:sigma-70 family RNA polymerase sigma factor [Streptomyces sp. 21So2-11]|uniref:RNA polymerase sigma factor n=1 Tax=Streptomyces sp. 21So2-11 TaxID=3144408 RepID=UPI0032193E35